MEVEVVEESIGEVFTHVNNRKCKISGFSSRVIPRSRSSSFTNSMTTWESVGGRQTLNLKIATSLHY
jgi:hypothetical protein